MSNRIKSFTLSELLVVMIITAIVVGFAFSVLRQVQKQIHTIQVNYEKNNALAMFEQRLWQDFNSSSEVRISNDKMNLLFFSLTDTIEYRFENQFILCEKDSIKLSLTPEKAFLFGKETNEGNVDAISISAITELPEYHIFVSRTNDAAFLMNQDGL